jgi:2-methylisocitrate lyase-like PEP mutase family enzyme
VDRPVNVLVLPGGPTVPELAGVGVARISVGGALAWVAMGAAARAARELLGPGTTEFLHGVASAREATGEFLR